MSELDTDNDTDDEWMGTPGTMDNEDDIDDYDPEQIMVGQVFDLALQKVYHDYTDTNMDGVLSPGDDVEFKITVYNQGTLDAFNVQVTDYIPTGLTLNDGNWNNISNPNEAQLNSVIASLPAQTNVDLYINFTIDLYWRGDKIVNWAEISSADDDMDPTNTYPTDMDSEPNSDITDDNFGGDNEINNNNNDEDDHDPAEINPVVELDLALAKIDQSTDPIAFWGQHRTFDIEVTNQGTIVATEFTVVDYIPCGMEFVNSPGSNPGWTYDSSTRIAEFIYDEMILVPGQTITLQIELSMEPCPTGDPYYSHTNYSEISDYDDDFDDFNPDIPDVDSDPDATNFDDPGGEPWGPTDDYIDGDGTGPFGGGPADQDEDDHDPAKPELFDLALKKELITINDPYRYGDLLEFKITVCNQGNIGAQDVVIADYLPAGYDFSFANNPGWSGTVAEPIYEFATIAIDECEETTIFLTVQMTTGGEKDWINYSEIQSAFNENGDDRTDWDIDSVPGTDSDDENDVEPGDAEDNDLASTDKGGEEDDHDPAGIELLDLAQRKLTPNQQGPFLYGDIVYFNIEVYNQGSIQASDIVISDYIPCGFIYDPTNDGNGWSYDPATRIATRTVAGPIVPGDDVTIGINLEIQQCLDNDTDSFTNYTEISDYTSDDPDYPDPVDVDSNDDTIDDNDSGGTPDDPNEDDVITGDSYMGDDEDDHDPERIEVFDLALKKELVTINDPYRYGDLLEFKITVCNQGNVDAQNIEVTDYLPDGYSFSTANNTGWVNGADGPVYAISGTLVQDNCTDFPIFLTIEQTNGGEKDWENYAEITSSTDTTGTPRPDADSVEGTDSAAENEVEHGHPADNDLESTDRGGEEDDHDPAGIELLDLALRKTTPNEFGPYRYGDLVTFSMDVFNQGSVLTGDIEVSDYLPCGLEYVSSNDALGWSYNSLTRMVKYTFPGTIVPGGQAQINITLEIHPCHDMPVGAWTNDAEISQSISYDPDYPVLEDVDSETDDDPSNDLGGNPGEPNEDDYIDGDANMGEDEDDHDPERIDVFDLAIRKTSTWMGIDSIGPFVPGDIVEFHIEVFNQGNVDAYDVVITDYLNAGFIFDPAINPGWSLEPGNLVERTIDGPLVQGESMLFVLNLEIQVNSMSEIGDWYNEAEISDNKDVDGTDREDADSYPDDNPDNDNDLVDGPDEDDVFNGDENDNVIDELIDDPFNEGDDDEDDNDAAEVIVIGALCGHIWEDCNGDGVRNDGPTYGLQGVQVDVFNEYDVYIGSAITNANGFYILENLIPGNYYIKVNKPEGYEATDFRQGTVLELDSDLNDSNGSCTSPLAPVRGGDCDPGAWDAGLYQCVPVGGTVWYDINENDIMDPFENGINGLPVELYQLKNGVWSLVETQLTDHKPGTPSDDGYYKFCVQPGTYEVRFDIPNYGLVPTISHVGAAGNLPLTNPNESNVDSDVNFNQTTGSFTVDCNMEDVCNIGAGYYPQAQIGNRVWHDANGDGMQSAAEVGVAGVLVEAYDANDQMINSDVTNTDGEYLIDYLGKNEYYLKVVPPASYGATTPHAGDDNMDSDLDNSNGYMTTNLYSLNPGDNLPNVDVGLVFGVVPVEWLSFTGENRGAHNILNWSTASEVNSDYFEIERAIENTTDFVSIGKVAAAGNSSTVQDYEAKDYDIEEEGSYYYRLKQVDLNGTFVYSDIVLIRVQSDVNVAMEMYPNPASDVVNLDLDLNNPEKLNVSIWDVSGKLIRANAINVELSAGQHTQSIDLDGIPAGMYTFHITVGQHSFKKKLIIVNE